QAIDVLHLVGDVARQRLHAQQSQDVVRIRGPVDDRLALVDDLTIVRRDVLVFGYQILVRGALHVGDHQALLALGVLAERDRPGNFRQWSGGLWSAGLEQLRDAQQTARAVV